MEKCSFFDSINGDRKYFSLDWAEQIRNFFTNGVFNNGLQVISNNDMTVSIKKGNAHIEGRCYINTDSLIKSIDTADGVLDRIDNVVIRLDLTNRLISAQIIKGTFAETPTPPALVRTSTIYDIRLATISIPHGTTSITTDLITDTRFITSDCGNVIATVETPDTEDLFLQLQASAALVVKAMQADEAKLKSDATALLNGIDDDFDTFISACTSTFNTKISGYDTTFNGKISGYDTSFTNKMSGFDTVFNTWFNSIKDQIDDDLGTSLQLQINQIKAEYIKDPNYVHTDNNYSNIEKGKVSNAATKIPKLESGLLKRETITLIVANWEENSETYFYEYDIINNEITSNTCVDLFLPTAYLDKIGLSSTESYDGGFKIIAKEVPTENITGEIRYQLSNIDLGGVS